MKSYRWLFFLLLLSSCQLQTVNVDTYFVGPETLASYWVGTPDPKRCCPDVGQELVLGWNMPECYLAYEDLFIRWTIRFGNHEEEVFEIPIRCKRGERVYALLNQAYWDRCGIQTYKVEVIGCNTVLKTLCNAVWTDVICVGDQSEGGDGEDSIEWVE